VNTALIGKIYFQTLATHSCQTCTYTGCYKKSSPPKTFWNIFTSVKSFCVKFCKFVGNSYPQISTNFCTFILIFHQMALIFPRLPIVFFLSSFEYRPVHTKKLKCTFSEMTSFFVIACLNVRYCKQSITVWFVTINILLTLLLSLVESTNENIVLQRQTTHADVSWVRTWCKSYHFQLPWQRVEVEQC